MKRRMKLALAAALTFGAAFGGGGPVYAQASSAQLRAGGQVGEQANGYLGIVGTETPLLRAQVAAINIRRRASYTELAARRGVQIEEVAATMACEIFATSILPGQYYRLPDGIWRRREGNARVMRPPYCV